MKKAWTFLCVFLKRRALLPVAFAFIFFVHPLSAQAFTNAQIQNAQQQSGQIQRQQQLQQQDERDKALQQRGQTQINVTPPPLQKGQGAGCRLIRRIELLNPVHMPKAERKKLVAPFEGKCLGVDQIEKLMSAVTAFYINKGYVTTRVYLPAQDLSTGILKLRIVPGKVGAIKTDERKTQINYLGNIFPDVVGHDLNLRDFEQGIDQINRLLSNNATIDIAPGARAGESVVTINNNPGRHWRVSANYNDYGAATTGRDQGGVTASFDDVAGLEDFTALTINKTLPPNDGYHQATAESLLMSLPLGYSTLSFSYNYSDYDSTILSGATNLHLSGTDNAGTVTLDRVIWRGRTDKADVSAALTNDDTLTYIDGQEISVSSRVLTYLTLAANYSTQTHGGTATLGAAYARGLGFFDALHDAAGIASSVPHAQFDKYTLTAGYSRPFSADRQNFVFSTQFSGQYAPYALYGNQQFSIGGPYTVRGFLDEAVANDDGFYLRNDLTLLESATIGGRTFSIRPLVALDAGAAGSVHAGTQSGMLAGAAAGTDIASGAADFNLLAGHPLIYPSYAGHPGFNLLGRFSVTF